MSSAAIAAAAPGLSTSGSQWSENGSDTMRRPVSQLSISHSTMPFERAFDRSLDGALGGALDFGAEASQVL